MLVRKRRKGPRARTRDWFPGEAKKREQELEWMKLMSVTTDWKRSQQVKGKKEVAGQKPRRREQRGIRDAAWRVDKGRACGSMIYRGSLVFSLCLKG